MNIFLKFHNEIFIHHIEDMFSLLIEISSKILNNDHPTIYKQPQEYTNHELHSVS